MIKELKLESIVTAASARSLIGEIGEAAAYDFLIKNGYSAKSFKFAFDTLSESDYRQRPHNWVAPREGSQEKSKFLECWNMAARAWEKEAKDVGILLGERLENFKQYSRAIGFLTRYEARQNHKTETPPSRYVPDIIASKDSIVYVIEVKSNSSRPVKEKLASLRLAHEYGLTPVLLNVEMEVIIKNVSTKNL